MNNRRLRLKEKPFSDRLPAEIKQHMDELLLSRDKRIEELEEAIKHSNELFEKQISELRRYVRSLEEFINRLNMQVHEKSYYKNTFFYTDNTGTADTTNKIDTQTTQDQSERTMDWRSVLQRVVQERFGAFGRTPMILSVEEEVYAPGDSIIFRATYMRYRTGERRTVNRAVSRYEMSSANLGRDEICARTMQSLADYIYAQETE